MITINHRWKGTTLVTDEKATSLKDAVVSAVARGAYLRGADLEGADLRGADLEGADLRGAYLRGADLRGADLEGADLEGAYLEGADLEGADLEGADLEGAYLEGADLEGAYLEGAYLPAPTMILLAEWGEVSPQLCGDLMVYDAANHPDPTAFERWAARTNGRCPYDEVKVGRAAHFTQKREHWAIGKPCRPYDLMTRVLEEKCPAWTDDQRKEFLAKFEGRNGNKK